MCCGGRDDGGRQGVIHAIILSSRWDRSHSNSTVHLLTALQADDESLINALALIHSADPTVASSTGNPASDSTVLSSAAPAAAVAGELAAIRMQAWAKKRTQIAK